MTRRSKDIFRQKSAKRAPSPPPVEVAPDVSHEPDDVNDGSGLRLQKVMAAAGVGSRRHCEELILGGRVEIDGRTVRKLGTKVEPTQHEIRVDGEVLKVKRSTVYYLVNKPDGVVCTNYDPAGRARVVDLVPSQEGEHLFTVGRLDMSSEGLILVTNDGELANRLTHPKYGVEKTYVALVAGQMSPETVEKLRNGVHLAEGMARCVSVHLRKTLPQSTLVEIVLSEGKNREIRRILAKVGHKVLKLKRTAIGRVKIREMKPGEYRRPSRDELQQLRAAAERPPQKRPRPRVDRKPKADTAVTSDVTPIVDTRSNKPAWKGDESAARRPTGRRGVQRNKKPVRRPPGSGTVIGADE
jgi:23S rRNA pseudouridine2605 synthase